MSLESLAGKKIGILGFGQEGQAVLSYLLKHNFTATVFDERPQKQWPDQASSLAAAPNISVETGPDYLSKINSCEILFRSPGIWRNHPQILAAEQSGSTITSQAKWFFDNCPARVIGVTGTKGKGTTSSLIYETLKSSAKSAVYLTGNIGKTQPLEFLDDLAGEDWVVYEMSSFQLQDLTVSPHIGVCLMVTSDHLNHHNDLAEYHSAKSAITAFQTKDDVAIANIDYEPSALIGAKGDGQKLHVSAKLEPQAGAYIAGNSIRIKVDGNSYELDCSERKLKGDHNLENLAAAALASLKAGANIDTILATVKSFTGLEHRLQFVGSFQGVGYYNDSISTIPETTMVAVRSFTEPIHLFLGGSDKGLSYSGLIEELGKHASHIASIVCVGETGAIIKTDLDKTVLKDKAFGPYFDFEQAVSETIARAKSGEVVLLSPASASFDMFDNYAQRGRKFVELVKKYTNG